MLSEARALRPLFAPAALAALGWLVVVAMTSAWWLALTPSPLAVLPRIWHAPAGWSPAAGPVGTVDVATDWHLALFAVALAAGAAPLAWALARARHIAQTSRAALWLVLGVTAALGLLLLLLPVLPSDDIFSYILYGRIGALYHANPLLATPSQFAGDPFLTHVFWSGTRSVYGPAWLIASEALTWLAQALGGSAAIYVLLYRLLALGCHLASAILIWGILTRVAPERRLLGTLLYAWNPLALWEFAAAGHNDAMMIAAFLAGVWLIVRGREKTGLVWWGVSIAVKYVFVLALALWLWRAATRVMPETGEEAWHLWMRRAWAVAWRAGIALGTAAALTLPFWAGPGTFAALAASPAAQSLDNSPMDLISWPLGWLAGGLFHVPDTHAHVVTALKVIGTLGALAVLAILAWRRAARDPLGAWGWALAGYIVLASGWFWPWYVTWPLAVVALRPLDRLTTAILLLSAGVLTLYGFLPVTASPIYGLRAAIAFGPALVYLAWSWRRRPAAQSASRAEPVALSGEGF
jgi:hypothetical protein